MAIDAIAAKVITTAVTAGAAATPPAAGEGGSDAFGASLARLVDTVEASNTTANTAVSGMLQGQVDVHDAMIALQRADLTLQLAVQVRNKFVNAYHEIMRMPV